MVALPLPGHISRTPSLAEMPGGLSGVHSSAHTIKGQRMSTKSIEETRMVADLKNTNNGAVGEWLDEATRHVSQRGGQERWSDALNRTL